MSITLRDYQIECIDRVRKALKTHRRVLLQAPTGAGKTAMSSHMMGEAAKRNRPSLFIVHRQELIEQTAATFDKVGIEYGYCAAGYPFNPSKMTLICSIDTLKNDSRLNAIRGTLGRNFLVWDEAHHVAAAGWAKVMAAFPDAIHVGLTATPMRLDGKGLDDHFDYLVPGPSVSWLIDEKHLVDYKLFAPSAPDMSKAHSLGGDWRADDAAEAMADLTGDAVEHYRKHSPGKRAVAFCVSVAHSEAVADRFKREGIPAASLDGTHGRDHRKAVLDDFRAGRILVLTNVALFGEGFDLPAIETAILLRPTKSLALYLQQVGRALRTNPGKQRALILDHAGNVHAHGRPCDDREWSLTGKPKAGSVTVCKACYFAYDPTKAVPRGICPNCGAASRNDSEDEGKHRRELTYSPEELKEVDVAAERAAKRREFGMATSLQDLVKLATDRGYKKPQWWAAKVWTEREAARQKRAEEQFKAYSRR